MSHVHVQHLKCIIYAHQSVKNSYIGSSAANHKIFWGFFKKESKVLHPPLPANFCFTAPLSLESDNLVEAVNFTTTHLFCCNSLLLEPQNSRLQITILSSWHRCFLMLRSLVYLKKKQFFTVTRQASRLGMLCPGIGIILSMRSSKRFSRFSLNMNQESKCLWLLKCQILP